MHSTVWQRAAISNRAVNLQTVLFQCAFYNLMQLKWRNKLWTILLLLQLGGFTGKKRERTFMKFLLLVCLKIFVHHQTDSDISKVFCMLLKFCKSVVSCFPLRSQFKSRYSYFSPLKHVVKLLSGFAAFRKRWMKPDQNYLNDHVCQYSSVSGFSSTESELGLN